ncbi:NosR/NirI family nitrous oxide reductase transcriptional regulator [Roseinatronobacter bogoriensis subsp. barguzinensis]|uniref:Regulatory protein NosR n=2 Tax=Roseinatronobacter bogoriensis TaxID=119542 RepID=A0A2K8KME3_9RHOB|nr:regulatory protein NosR [Rhodobaca barguzinensis]TDW39116.1 NosR/NirI family nitrous oxide reductase transcriptional regulator [Rhodobaca barguzinensis]TDY66436.1 NosR/NirI family nitrous oxide reductase transcriptional regulator [Rhodobaca bogoriensis DSM 18756]
MRSLNGLQSLFASALMLVLWLVPAITSAQTPHLQQFMSEIAPHSIVETATDYGAIRDDLPVAPILGPDGPMGWVFITSDFVGTTGYGGKPIHVMVALDDAARIIGARLVEHSEPIVIIGIPESRIHAVMQGIVGLDVAELSQQERRAPQLEIVSGVTVTVMVIDDSIQRSALHVARRLGLGGLSVEGAQTGPRFALNPDARAAEDWPTLSADGTVQRLTLDVGQVNAAFGAHPDPRAAERPLTDPPDTLFIDLFAAQISHDSLGARLLPPEAQAQLQEWLTEGAHPLWLGARGMQSFKGTNYRRGGVFDRIVLVQGENSIRFREEDHLPLDALDLPGAPHLKEIDLFRIPADAGFAPTAPWRLQLVAQRNVSGVDRAFTFFELPYQLAPHFLRELPRPAPQGSLSDAEAERAAQMALIERIWQDRQVEIAGLAAMLLVLTGVFFFQGLLTRSARATYWFRIGFLSLTLFFLGWYANAQLSVVNILALTQSLMSGFSWQAFLLDPLTFILWFSVAAALIFWGRGAYCGWLCPFGALQELTNQIARRLRVPQLTLPWGLHERLWPVKYMIFLALFGASLASLSWGETLAEVEPFKTAIVLKFDRAWPFVTFALVLLGIGLFIERFYCRYLCPLGAALAIPARIRMFDWLKRYKECGSPCQTCRNDCFVQAIHPTGEINPNECLNCLNCQVLYQSQSKCPVVIRQIKRRAVVSASGKSDAKGEV